MIDRGTPSILPRLVIRQNIRSSIGSTFHVVRGTDVVIDCPSSGAIPVGSEDYQWYYKGKLLYDKVIDTLADTGKFFCNSTIQGRSTLMIRNISRSDNGEIQCVVFNPAGKDSSMSDLRGVFSLSKYIVYYQNRM